MNLNHLHINVPSVEKAKRFYTEFFDFEVAFGHGEGVFLKDKNNFLLAIDPLGENEHPVEFPSWFHLGFCLDSSTEVKELYKKMKSMGIEFAREYKEFDDVAVNFYCWAPGPFKVEVSWNKEE